MEVRIPIIFYYKVMLTDLFQNKFQALQENLITSTTIFVKKSTILFMIFASLF